MGLSFGNSRGIQANPCSLWCTPHLWGPLNIALPSKTYTTSAGRALYRWERALGLLEVLEVL